MLAIKGYFMRRLAISCVSIIVVILFISGIAKQAAAATPTLINTATASPTRTSVPLPVDVTVSGTYFHPSGIFSVPLVNGWDLIPNFENQIVPTIFDNYAEVDTTFLNRTDSSVVSIIIEKVSSVKLNSIQDASAYLTNRYFSDAWANYSGGFSETARRIERDRLIIDFKVRDRGEDYLSRQVSRVNKGWLITIRIVVPGNDPELLNRLDQKLTPGLTFYPDLAAVPLEWVMLRDTSTTAPAYFVKYPAQWVFNPTLNTVDSVLSGATVSLNVTTELNKAARTVQSARAWVTAAQANAKILTVKAETRGTVTGFSVSYQYTNPEGTPQNAVATLLNSANNTLYTLTIKLSAGNVDLLSPAADFLLPDLTRVRSTFTLLPPGSYLSLPRPKGQATSGPTNTPAPNPLAFDMKTAQIYRSPDRVLEMKLPIGWTPRTASEFKEYTFVVKPNGDTNISVSIDTLADIYQSLTDDGSISKVLDADTLSAETLLKALRDEVAYPDASYYTDVHPIKVGTLPGFAFSYKVASRKPNVLVFYEVRIAALPDGEVVYVAASAYNNDPEKVAPVITTMLDSLVINSERIPTPTITPTPYPLLLTATALQQKIHALTGTPNSQISATATPTSTATLSLTARPTQTMTVSVTPSITPTARPIITSTPSRSATRTPTTTPVEMIGSTL